MAQTHSPLQRKQKIIAAAGSSSAPSFTFQGDTDSGFFAPAGDTVALAVAGSEILRFDPAGNFGLGKTSPDELFHVSGNIATDAHVLIGRGDGSHVRLKNDAGTLVLRNAADNADANLTVGDLTVNGTLTSVNSSIVELGDEYITLNNDYTGGTPTSDAGIRIERGTITNASLLWDETADIWKAGLLGSETQVFVKNASGQLVSAVGSASLPGIAFEGDLDSGFYNTNGSFIGVVMNAAEVFRFATGQFQLPDGSASTPALAFMNDINTGLFSSGADELAFARGGALAMTLNASGLVLNSIPLLVGGTTVISSSGTMDWGRLTGKPNLAEYDQNVTVSGDWTFSGDIVGAATFVVDGVGNAVVGNEGVTLSNTTAAVVNATGDDGQQYSPSLRFSGQGFETTGSTSMNVDFRQYVKTIQGSAAPTGEMRFEVSVDGGAFTTPFKILSNGDVVIAGTTISGGGFSGDGSSLTGVPSTGISDFQEAVEDVVGAFIAVGTGISWTYDDGAGTMTPTVSLSPFDTDDLSEGSTNLYYSNERVDDRVAVLIQDGTGITWTYDDGAGTLTPSVGLGSYTTTDVSEGTNLYFTDERVDDRVAVLFQSGTGISYAYNDTNGTMTPTVTLSPFTTSQLAEGSNLYYTQARFDSAFTAKSTSDLSEGTNLYYTTARWDTKMAAADTGDLSEGSNLYYTDTRVDTRVQGQSYTITGTWTFSNAPKLEGSGALFQGEASDPAGTAGYLQVWSSDAGAFKYRYATGTVYTVASVAYVDAMVWDTSDITTGTFADARIAESNVTQHESAVTIASSQVSDFTEAVQDVAGGFMTDAADASITYTYSDVGNTVTPSVHANLAAIVAGTWTGATSITTLGTIATGTWQGTAVQGAYTDIDVAELTDVTITSIAAGELLTWNGSAFVNETLAEADIAAASRTLTINGTANEVSVSAGSGDLTANRTWTISLPDDVTIGNDLTVTGTLTSGAITVTGGGVTATGSSTVLVANVGETVTDGEDFLVTNTTAAGAGAQQYSPAVRWHGAGWETNVGSSKDVDFRAYVKTIQGAAAPTAEWRLEYQVDGGGYSVPLRVLSNGDVVIAGATISGGGFSGSGASITGILSSNISDFTEAVQDVTGGQLQDAADASITFTYNDGAGTTTPSVHANLAAIVAGTWTGATSLTTLGTVATGVWQGTAVQGAYTDIDMAEITDVTISAIASGEVLKWNGSAFINQTLAEADIAAASRTITLAGTANEVTVSAGAQDLTANRTWTIGLPDDVTIGGDLTITGRAVFTAPAAPTNIAFTESTDTVDVDFDLSASAGIDRYEIHASYGDETDYRLIGTINASGLSGTQTWTDNTYDQKTTNYYRIYAVRNATYSAALTGNHVQTSDPADVSNIDVDSDAETYFVNYDIAADKRIDFIRIKKDANAASESLSEGSAVTVYEGDGDSFVYSIPEADLGKYHQFWVYTVART